MHVGKSMLEDQDLFTVLGNTIHGEVQNWQITSTDGNTRSVGLTELGVQDADTLLQCWKERINEVASAPDVDKKDQIEDTK